MYSSNFQSTFIDVELEDGKSFIKCAVICFKRNDLTKLDNFVYCLAVAKLFRCFKHTF